MHAGCSTNGSLLDQPSNLKVDFNSVKSLLNPNVFCCIV